MTRKLSNICDQGGRIFVHTHEEAEADPQPKPYVINNPDDLLGVGFSKEEVDAIINGPFNN